MPLVGAVERKNAYDPGDKLIDVRIGGVPIKTYGYDLAGRTTSVQSSAGQTILAYDYEDRLISIGGGGVPATSYTYNGLETRISKNSGSTTTYKRDGVDVVSALLKEGTTDHTPGISGRTSGTTAFSHAGLKNNSAQTSTGQTVSGTKRYDAFGLLTSATGSWQGVHSYGGQFGYQEDTESGLKLLGHRYYDSSTGRFITRDPIMHGRNWYSYCANNPTKHTDPTGLTELDSATHSQSFRITWELIREGIAPKGVTSEWGRQFGRLLKELGLKMTRHGWERLVERFPDIGKFLWVLKHGTLWNIKGQLWVIAGRMGIRVDENGNVITVVENISKKGGQAIESAGEFFRRLAGGK
jgi:RHS repeat-associated protein